jgi:peroxiredoxin
MRKNSFTLCCFALVLVIGASVLGSCDADGKGPAEVAASRPRSGPSLPRFDGVSLQGDPVSTDVFQRKRGLLLLVAEDDQGAHELAAVVRRVQADAEHANVTFLGISRDRDTDDGAAFVKRLELDFPFLWDPSRSVSRKLRAGGHEAAVVVVDGDGSIILGFQGFEGEAGLDSYERAIREALRLESDTATKVSYGVRPQAPAFTVEDLEGNSLSLDDLEDQVVVLIFFLHTCPHCHDSLEFLAKQQKQLQGQPLAIVPISIQNNVNAVKGMRTKLGIDLALYVDPDKATQKAYAHQGSVPDHVILDKQHRVLNRLPGIEPRIEALMAMSIRNALGVDNPILLKGVGYSGQEMCTVCHESQHETWSLTSHAYAFDTLVEHGANKDAECLPCHVVGWQEEGGYSLDRPQADLEGVQCESCHGRGGPHQSPEFVKAGFESACLSCHNPEHSLQFHFADRLPLVSHAANLQFANLSLEERQGLLERRDKRVRVLFNKAEFVGSESCRSCHASEFDIWAQSPHAKAWASLEAKHAAENADCQGCHSTGFGEPGGFPQGGADRARVGCESCHGPGGDHVAENARKDGTILALSDKCDSCVILQICGSCHDEANDPGFEFEVVDKIDAIRHGFRDREPEAAAE